MLAAIKSHRPQIEELCRRFRVKRLDLFGSAARERDFTEESDFDLLVEFEATASPPAFSDFLDFRDALADLLGRKVDLTMAGAIRNPYLKDAIERSRLPLHGA
ncbi:MAG TPA: nucleotidyltransferase domain-containing protein [Caulobacteraceae bacterium]|nr:nucleotidyltransferase domain-containing protein [Caulobacteraceae bacterium]